MKPHRAAPSAGYTPLHRGADPRRTSWSASIPAGSLCSANAAGERQVLLLPLAWSRSGDAVMLRRAAVDDPDRLRRERHPAAPSPRPWRSRRPTPGSGSSARSARGRSPRSSTPATTVGTAGNGSEINDNGYPWMRTARVPGRHRHRGRGTYVLQREFNNAGVLESDPYAPGCARGVQLVAPVRRPRAR